MSFANILECNKLLRIVLRLDIVEDGLYFRILLKILRLFFIEIKLVKMVLNADGFSGLYFFSDVGERADIISYIDDGEFGVWYGFFDKMLMLLYEIVDIDMDFITDFGGEFIPIEAYIFRDHMVHY